ncbi:MAG: hypothetical protein AB1716_07555 [Planctomycetota bacterium]
MSSPPSEPDRRPIDYATAPPPGPAARESAVGLLVAGAVCLYFGFTLDVTAPGTASEAATQQWFAWNTALNWALRILGFLFLGAAALAWTGQRVALLLTTIVEGLFTALMLVMTVSWTIEARADDGFNYQAILLLLLAILSAGSAARAWRLYAVTRPADTAPPGFGPQP